MSDRLPKSNPLDPLTIDTGLEFDVRYWSRVLGISKAQLREAVAAAGSCNVYQVARCAGCDLAAMAQSRE
jgi:hypothetical protein